MARLSLDWRGDRSYLWSVFVGEMTAAAIALEDQSLCEQLLADLVPAGDTCAVNGALVCFMGAHAHRVGLLHAALGQPALAQAWLTKALQVHRRLGARAWEAKPFWSWRVWAAKTPRTEPLRHPRSGVPCIWTQL
jgi:hypothetical protein